MFTEFEQLETALMVEIIRLRQNPIITSKNVILNGDLNISDVQFVSEKCLIMSSLEQDMENFIKSETGKLLNKKGVGAVTNFSTKLISEILNKFFNLRHKYLCF